jgi:hypothetical protein
MRYYKRGFLNKKEGIAAFECQVDALSLDEGTAFFKITDCNRSISLDFDWWKNKPKKMAVDKLNALITEMTKFRDEISNLK